MSAITRVRFALYDNRSVGTGPGAGNVLIDQFTGGAARIPYASALNIEVGFFKGLVLDLAPALTSLTVEIKSATNHIIDHAGAALFGPTPISVFNSNLTQAEWDNISGDTPYHGVFTFTTANMSGANLVSAAVNNEQEVGLVFMASGSSGSYCMAAGLAVIVKTGATAAVAADIPTTTRTYDDQSLDSRFANTVQLGLNPAGSAVILQTPSGKKIRWEAVDFPDGDFGIQATKLG